MAHEVDPTPQPESPSSAPAQPEPADAVVPPAPSVPAEAPPIAGFEQPTPQAPAVAGWPAPGVPPAHPTPPAQAGPGPIAPEPPVQIPPPPPTQQHGMRPGVVIGIAAILALVIASFVGLAAGLLGARLVTQGSLTPETPAKITVVPSKTSDPAVAAAAAAVPSVVNIDVRNGVTSGGESGTPQSHPDIPSIGNGSGVAYKSAPDGGTYVITNNHVVESADKMTVRDSSGRSYPAKLVGRDPETDIAVIKVDAKIPTIELGISAKLVVGQTVVAIGSPFGLEHSVTSGVVSALGRSLPNMGTSAEGSFPLVDVIQTDAAINPGNSGGALVTTAGQLIGVNTAIYSESGSSGGIGFAVPGDTAIRVADQLIDGGEIRHPFIGVIGQTVTAELAQAEGLTAEEGAYVADLTAGSGSEKAGVKIGDVITAVDNEPIRTMDDLILQVRRKKVGDTVKLTLLRDGQSMTLDVAVGDKPAGTDSPGSPVNPDAAPDN